jgi:hypothetical protein
MYLATTSDWLGREAAFADCVGTKPVFAINVTATTAAPPRRTTKENNFIRGLVVVHLIAASHGVAVQQQIRR